MNLYTVKRRTKGRRADAVELETDDLEEARTKMSSLQQYTNNVTEPYSDRSYYIEYSPEALELFGKVRQPPKPRHHNNRYTTSTILRRHTS